MRILYTTDLHGSKQYYDTIFSKAQLHTVDLVINGGDLLPKTSSVLKRQREFLRVLEKSYFPRWEKAGIHYICCPGNDDARVFDSPLAKACSKFEYVHYLAPEGELVRINGFDFIGFNLVCDYPFGIKDRCRMDRQDFVFPEQIGIPAFTVEERDDCGWEKIEDWFSVAQGLPTLEDELTDLVRPQDMAKAIYIMHMPPAGLGLDVCMAGNRPASWAVREFLQNEQPLLSLHGHIHESYKMTGIWKAQVGKTWTVQPGQGGMEPVYCIIDTNDLANMERYGHDTETLMVDAYIPEGADTIRYIRISELPGYFKEPLTEWLSGKTQLGWPGEKPFDTPHVSDFEAFCHKRGIKIKLVLQKALKRSWTVNGHTGYFLRLSDLPDPEQEAFGKFLSATCRNAPLPEGETPGNTAWWHDYQAFARGENPYLGLRYRHPTTQDISDAEKKSREGK